MKYLLDTCVISESIKPHPEPAVLAWLGAQDEERLFLPSLVLGEIQKGIEKLEAGARRSRLEVWNNELAERFASRIVSIDGDSARNWGHITALLESRGQALAIIDGLIASLAICHGMTLATRDVADFENTGAELFNPWELASRI